VSDCKTCGKQPFDHAEWRKRFLKTLHPRDDSAKATLYVSHRGIGQAGDFHRYAAILHHKPGFDLYGAFRKAEESLAKAGEYKECPGGRWITVHPNGDEEKGNPVYICPNPDGTHTITGGAGGSLNGLRLTGVKSPEEYAAEGKRKRSEKRRTEAMAREALKQQLGDQKYKEHLAEIESQKKEAEAQARAAKLEAVRATAQTMGVDPSRFEVPKEVVAGLSPKVADRVVRRAEDAAWAWAKQVAEGVKTVVKADYASVAQDYAGAVGAEDLSEPEGGGLGYRAGIANKAAEKGLTEQDKRTATAEVAWKRYMEQSDRKVEEAAKKRQAVENRVRAGETARGEVKVAEEKAAQEGVGAKAIRNLEAAPNIENVGQAVEIMTAVKRAQLAEDANKAFVRELNTVNDAGAIPKAAVVVAKPMTPEEAKEAVIKELSDTSRHEAVTALVEKSNELGDVATLREHYSVGQSAAFNEIAQSVQPGWAIDPLAADILGPDGMATVMAARMRAALSPEELEAKQKEIEAEHIDTQVKIANEGVQMASSLMDAAEKIEVPEITDADTMEAALAAHAKKRDMIQRAKQSAGVARGRLEATSALIWSLKKKPGDALVSLGKCSTADAVEHAFALGLTDRDRFDLQTNELVHEGQFDIISDGENRILKVHETGLSHIGGEPDHEMRQRAIVSAAIKGGKEDQNNWLPFGITRRPIIRVDIDALDSRKADEALIIKPTDTDEEIEDKVSIYIGSRINDGHDPLSIQEDMWSESFMTGLGLSEGDEARYRNVLDKVAPFLKWRGTENLRDISEMMKQHIADLSERMDACADKYIRKERRAHWWSDDESTLNRQRIHYNEESRDSLYQAVASEPALGYAFHGFNELTNDGRAAIRSYAFRHLFHIDPKEQEPINPLTPQERRVFDAWSDFKDKNGEPYRAIQKHWVQSVRDEPANLLGENPEPPVFATVDLSDYAAVLRMGKEHAAELGYEPLIDPKGNKVYPELEPGKSWKEAVADPGGKPTVVEMSGRTEEAIVNDIRRRTKAKLREHFVGKIAHAPTLAGHFNPDGVHTSSDRWNEYVSDMGGEQRAYRTVQEFMIGDLSKRFGSIYSQRSGGKMKVAQRQLTHHKAHVIAMLSPEKRQQANAKRRSDLAKVGQDSRGRFTAGERTTKVETAKVAEEQTPRLFGSSEAGDYPVPITRATLGKLAEAALKQMTPRIDITRPVEVAGDVSMSGASINRQRAIKLIAQNKRMAICLGTGQGKTLVGIGAFTWLKGDQKANRALICVPSNIVAQFGGEFYKFVNPDMKLRWYADPTAEAKERQEAYADPKCDAVVVTPEALREDITNAVAEDMGKSKEDVRDMMATMSPGKIDEIIHSAMGRRGWVFDFAMLDEAHRLLDRQGKPDAHMARIAASATRTMPYLIYATADPVKNDASEVHSVLSLLDPQRYNEENKETFYRRYQRNTPASMRSLQAELEPYMYAENADIGVRQERALKMIELDDEEYSAYNRINQLVRDAKSAKAHGKVNIEALKALAPHAFEGNVNERQVAKRLTNGIEAVADQARRRAIMPAKVRSVASYVAQHKGEPTVIFSHNIDSVKALAEKLKEDGHRVGVLTGNMPAARKDRVQMAFSPPSGEAEIDVLVCSDAAAMGANLQRGYHLCNFDTPDTAMLHEQRIGREARVGQKHKVMVNDFVVNVGYDMARRKRMEDKELLRTGLVGPSVDDTGAASRFEAEMDGEEAE
jgi:superfamily II DNA or RNA helicase